MTVAIIGLGLIGGSVGLRLKKSGMSDHIIGIDKNETNCAKALELRLVDEVAGLLEGVKKSDVVVIAIPVDQITALLPRILDNIQLNAVVIDMGSTKGELCKSIDNHPNRKAFVASHPIAGTENSGPEAAFDSLFQNKTGILCDIEKSSPEAAQIARELYVVLGMKIIEMGSQAHDLHIAYVSHLSHISSFVLGQTVLEIEKDEKSIFNMAGSGFASTVRLAKSSPNMWAPIFAQNKEHISKSLGTYIQNLKEFKAMVDNENVEGMYDAMKNANQIRKVLDGIDLKGLNTKPDKESIIEN
ncbi:prephenate dehydrogenase [Reichenbachiella sp. MALMAid0571]|uniref:prephenate dehydrogenase n=1 Tax=Reichenbachiella sp. MALMAid0571 TaxID=3143939 RepID=UPI0032DFCF65